MKRILNMCWMVFIIMLFSASKNKASAQVEASVSYQTFYNDLSPYGEWIDYPEYGYVWHPDINDFRPYSTGGHWVWTDGYGWMWASDYDWGWAAFHYGRWLYDDFYGWVWVPGYEWSPAWVEWRTGGDYYGWAPLGPGIDISLNFSFGRYSPPYNYWCFVPRNYILSPRVYDYCLPQSRNTIIINNTTVINNYYRSRNVFVTGPGRSEVERYTGRINPFVLRESSRPGRPEFRRNTVSIFRPSVQRNDNRVAPRNFERYNGQNGNAFQRREQDIANNNGERRKGFERRDQNNGRVEQRNNNNVFERRQQEQSANEQRRNGNPFERRQQNISRDNNIRRQQAEQKNNFEQQQRENGNAERRQNEMRQQQEIRRQQLEQQNNIVKEQRENRNVFERRQNEMRQQQEQRNNFERRQNEMRQQQEQRREVDQQRQNNGFERRQQQFNQPSQQQSGNPFQQRQEQSQGNGNGKGRGHGRHD
jgi:hypothetical protein